MHLYLCTFTGDYQPEVNRRHNEKYTLAQVKARWPCMVQEIERLAVGESCRDSDGDTWERIA